MLKPTINFTVLSVFIWIAIVAVFAACVSRSRPDAVTLALMIGCQFISAALLIWYTFVAIHTKGKASFSLGYVVTYFLLIVIRYANKFDLPSEVFQHVMYYVLPHNTANTHSNQLASGMRDVGAMEFCRILCSMIGGLTSLFVARLYAPKSSEAKTRSIDKFVRD